MSNKKQSSVDYLIEQLLPKALSAEQFYHIQQAKEMHEEEMKESYWESLMSKYQSFEHYYGETYGGKQ